VFTIRRVDRSTALAVEPLGSKPKFWFKDSGNTWFLFKADDRGTGEDWAEVVAARLCALLGLPHVEYELAEEWNNEKAVFPGVVCPNMSPPPMSLVLGNQLLLERDPNYPKEQRFKVRKYTIEAVSSIVETLALPDSKWFSESPAALGNSLDVFVGYIMLDALIANQDRHHENWAAIRGRDELRLAPTFDHGAALARNLTDIERADRLGTKDRQRSVETFARRARSAFYADEGSAKPLATHEAFRLFASKAPTGTKYWVDRLTGIATETVRGILNEVPPQRMSPTTSEFTLKLLTTNRELILQDRTP
jgi:hypothetical protein